MRTPLAIVAALSILAAPAGAQQRRQGAPGTAPDGALPPRESWQRVPDIVAALGPVQGRRVADIGAGRGLFTKALSARVGPAGRVYAVEISDDALKALAALRDSFPNVEVVTGTETDPRLPLAAGALDAALIVNSYHELTKHEAVLAALRRALRPGGLLVVVDNGPTDDAWPRDEQASHHGLAPRFAVAELEAAGYEIAARDDGFIVRPFPQWMLVARRPAR
jgi:ubiquinone/menaquinone biosynthesis C-methylase UbiE